jgi:hypothetical protein
MEKWYEFTARDTPAQYGLGSPEEAESYCSALNRGRRERLYSIRGMGDADPAWITRLDSGEDTDGFRLDEALVTLGEIA